MAPLVKSFEATNPNIKVNVTYTPVQSYPQALYTQLQAGNAADVVYTNGGTGQQLSVLPLGKSGYLADLADQGWAKNMPAAARSLYWSGNKLYGLPMGLSMVGVVYNVDLFHQLGLQIPTTFDELVRLCPKIKASGKTPLILAGQSPNLYAEALAAGTVYANAPNWDVQRQQGKVTFGNTKGWGTALSEFSQLNSSGCFQPGAAAGTVTQAFSALASGQAVMFLAPSAAIGAIEGINPSFHAAMFPAPGPTAQSTRAVVEYNDSFSLNARSPHRAAAMKLINFLAQPNEQDAYAQIQAEISIPNARAGKVPTIYQSFASYLRSGKQVVLPTLIWPNAEIGQSLTQGLQGLLTGQDTSSAVLRNMDNSWNSGSA